MSPLRDFLMKDKPAENKKMKKGVKEKWQLTQESTESGFTVTTRFAETLKITFGSAPIVTFWKPITTIWKNCWTRKTDKDLMNRIFLLETTTSGIILYRKEEGGHEYHNNQHECGI